MITTKLNGGLGNKMFQIAVAYAIALNNNDVCAFNLDDKVVNQGNIARMYDSNILKKVDELPSSWFPENFYNEKGLNFNVIPYKNNMILHGYFQSDKYFLNCKNKIINLFKDKKTIDYVKSLFNNDELVNSVSLHVRRGDYLKFQFHQCINLDYYDKAIAYMDEKCLIEHILVLSDDIQWCKENLKDDRMIFIEGYQDYIDLYIMSLCNHNIIANSSFSWWGSYLNENENKIICANLYWDSDKEIKDIYYDKINKI